MAESTKLRPYIRADLRVMVELDQICFEPAFQFDSRAMLRFAEGRRAHTIVAETAAGKVGGFVIVEIVGRLRRRCGYCVTLDVAPAERRSGVGARLLRAAEDWAVNEGLDRLTLHVWTRNEAAIRFYQRLGYGLEGLVPGFYGGEGMDALVYGKQIGLQPGTAS